MRMVHFPLTLSFIYRLLLIQEGIEAKQMQICEKMLDATGGMEDRINAKLDHEFSQINVQLGEMHEILGKILVHMGMPNVTMGTRPSMTKGYDVTTTPETTTEIKCLQDVDAFKYDGKCFWMMIMYSGPTQSYDYTRSKCKSKGGDVGNIYSQKHYNLVEEAARAKLMGTEVYFWTNMTYDRDTDKVYLGTTEEAPYIRWYSSSYPTNNIGASGIKIQFNSSPTSTNHGYYNRRRSESSRGVLCESSNQ